MDQPILARNKGDLIHFEHDDDGSHVVSRTYCNSVFAFARILNDRLSPRYAGGDGLDPFQNIYNVQLPLQQAGAQVARGQGSACGMCGRPGVPTLLCCARG